MSSGSDSDAPSEEARAAMAEEAEEAHDAALTCCARRGCSACALALEGKHSGHARCARSRGIGRYAKQLCASMRQNMLATQFVVALVLSFVWVVVVGKGQVGLPFRWDSE